jgi:hypothetical protein
MEKNTVHPMDVVSVTARERVRALTRRKSEETDPISYRHVVIIVVIARKVILLLDANLSAPVIGSAHTCT